MKPVVFICLAICLSACGVKQYDLVINNGQLIDPVSNTISQANIGVTDGKIKAITVKPLLGERTVNADGLMISAGFIDLHSHTPTVTGQKYQALDGVTTALELELGSYPTQRFADLLTGRALINYGSSASHLSVRMKVISDVDKAHILEFAKPKNKKEVLAYTQAANLSQISQITQLLKQELDKGALGIGLPLDYVSKAVNQAELYALFELSAQYQAPLFIHMRRGKPADDSGLKELISLSEKFKAPIHICHLNSSAMQGVEQFIHLIEQAQLRGVDITTEAYPYNAGSTSISAAVFNRDWQSIFNISYEDIEWAETGMRFNKQLWQEYRKKYPTGTIIHHYGNEAWTSRAVMHPNIIIASDAMPLVSEVQKVHPRGIATFSKTLHKYVLNNKLSLLDAIRKMTLLPAQRLEKIAPEFKRKGRLAIGADADITLFELDKINDRATYQNPIKASQGIEYVIVDGTVIIEKGRIVENVFPGQYLYKAKEGK